MGRLQRFFRWANIILIFLTLFAYVSPYIHPGTIWFFAVLGLLYPALLGLNLIFGIAWIVQRKRYALFSFGCILLGWSHFTAFVGLSFSGNTASPAKDQIRVLSYNIHDFMSSDGHSNQNRWSKTDVLEFYAQYQPDVWCFQEFSSAPKYANEYTNLITGETPLKYVYQEKTKGLAIFSRYPIDKIDMHYFGNQSNGFAIADLEKDGRKIRIFNVHLQSNAVSRLADEVTQNGQLQEKETWLQIKGMIGRYRRTAARRSDQAREIRKRLDESKYPVILCGDFNDVPLSYVYNTMKKGLTDGFRKKGRGIGTTFHGSLPALRIDYIFSSPELSPTGYQVLPVNRSDHYPVLSVLKIPEGAGD